MPTRAGEAPPIGRAAKQVAEHAGALARLELELAGLEVKRKAGALGSGIGLGVAALVLGWFGFGLALATVVAALALVLDLWLALLLVTLGLLLPAAGLAALALRRIRRGTPPVPEQAIAEAKLTAEAVRNGHG